MPGARTITDVVVGQAGHHDLCLNRLALAQAVLVEHAGDRLAADRPGIEHGRAVGVDQAELAGLGEVGDLHRLALPALV